MRSLRGTIPPIAAGILLFVAASDHAALLAQKSRSPVPSSPDDRTIAHVLNRIGFGPRPADVDRVRRMGLTAYLDAQLHPERLPDAAMEPRLANLETLRKSTRELAEDYFLPALMARRRRQHDAQDRSMALPDAGSERREMQSPPQLDAMRGERQVLIELSAHKILRAAYSERQLEEVMVDFWFNHFNVFAGKGLTRLYLTEYERDAIRPHVFGRFRDLLQATAESPAMLFYLDNWQSSAPNDERAFEQRDRKRMRGSGTPRSRPGIGRQRMPAGLLPAAQNRRPRGINENYARELMELHTLGVDGGYTQKDVQEVARAFTGWTIANPRLGGGFRFEPRMHDDAEKVVLGHRIKADGGRKDGEQVLDILAKHPSTARFIATKLARHFVSDDPPKALIDRAAHRFGETDGNIREVIHTIITSAEFFAPEAYRAKVKTPFEFVVSAVRATEADAVNAVPLVQALRELGMPLYMCQPPTGYADRAQAWVNTGALLNRMNFAVALTSGRLRGIDPTRQLSAPRDSMLESVLAGDVSESTAGTIAKATTTSQAIALVLGSPEFQRR